MYRRGDVVAKCRLCGDTVSRKDQTTSGMISHMKNHHGTYHKVYELSVKESKATKRPANEYKNPTKQKQVSIC
jgi:hypothetical protein